jgi:hypothetical protein
VRVSRSDRLRGELLRNGPAQVRFELFRDGRIMRSGGKCKVSLAIPALQETARAGHQDSETM